MVEGSWRDGCDNGWMMSPLSVGEVWVILGHLIQRYFVRNVCVHLHNTMLRRRTPENTWSVIIKRLFKWFEYGVLRSLVFCRVWCLTFRFPEWKPFSGPWMLTVGGKKVLFKTFIKLLSTNGQQFTSLKKIVFWTETVFSGLWICWRSVKNVFI